MEWNYVECVRSVPIRNVPLHSEEMGDNDTDTDYYQLLISTINIPSGKLT